MSYYFHYTKHRRLQYLMGRCRGSIIKFHVGLLLNFSKLLCFWKIHIAVGWCNSDIAYYMFYGNYSLAELHVNELEDTCCKHANANLSVIHVEQKNMQLQRPVE